MATAQRATAGQYLTFSLGEEQYGVEILRVQEIRGCSAITPIPNAPPYVRGVLNLRGAVVPVVDLRCRLGLERTAYTQFTVIIVVHVGATTAGLVVDAVSDVVTIAEDDIDDMPDLGKDLEMNVLRGVARVGERLVVLLDTDAAVAGDCTLELADA
jgi:purine-binding chemotaxis protein CheW